MEKRVRKTLVSTDVIILGKRIEFLIKAKVLKPREVAHDANLDVENENVNGNIGYQRSFMKFYKASVGLNMNWSRFNTRRINSADPENPDADLIQTTESFGQSYRGSLGTQFKKWPNVEVGYAVTLNDYQGETFKTQQPFVKVDYFFLDGFSFVANLSLFQLIAKYATEAIDNIPILVSIELTLIPIMLEFSENPEKPLNKFEGLFVT